MNSHSMRKEAVMAYFTYCLSTFLKWPRKARETYTFDAFMQSKCITGIWVLLYAEMLKPANVLGQLVATLMGEEDTKFTCYDYNFYDSDDKIICFYRKTVDDGQPPCQESDPCHPRYDSNPFLPTGT